MRLPSLKRQTARPRQPRPLPFTEAQIRERAYKLWQANPEGSAEAYWDGAIEALKRERSPVWRVKRLFTLALTAETPAAALDILKFVLSAFGVLATVFAGVGLYLTYQTSQEQQRMAQRQLESAQQERELNSERLVTDRFAKAVEQLGSQDIDVRIGGVYSLERIAKDSPKDHWTIMEVLTAFVRNKSPVPQDWTRDSKQRLPGVTTDVQSALTVIGRRDARNDSEGKRLNLSSANLTNAELSYVNLKGAILGNANLHNAVLNNANLSGAKLIVADLSLANLIETDLSFADLTSTNLETALLQGANLSFAQLMAANLDAFLEDANLNGANLWGTNFKGADLKGADLVHTDNLTTA